MSATAAPVGSLRHDATVISLVGFAHGTSHFFHFMLPPLFPWLMAEFGLGFTQVGLAMTVFFVVSGVGQALAGFVVDRFGITRSDEDFEKVRSNPRITMQDAAAIKKFSPLVRSVMAESSRAGKVTSQRPDSPSAAASSATVVELYLPDAEAAQVCASLAGPKSSLEIHPLSIGGKNDPAAVLQGGSVSRGRILQSHPPWLGSAGGENARESEMGHTLPFPNP